MPDATGPVAWGFSAVVIVGAVVEIVVVLAIYKVHVVCTSVEVVVVCAVY
jgi:hypothetical protein